MNYYGMMFVNESRYLKLKEELGIDKKYGDLFDILEIDDIDGN